MLREEYIRRIVDAAHVELYFSGNDGGRIYWPWRMHPPKEATLHRRNACERFIVDSDPDDDSVTAADVLDTAFRLDAEAASLQDVYKDKRATVDTLLAGLEVADDHPFGGRLLLPLQAPYVECWREIGEPTENMLGIGGLKEPEDAHRRLSAATRLREAVGPGVHIHGFGWGVRKHARRIREEPGLLDSVDYSSPIQGNAVNTASAGKEAMSVAAMHAGTQLVQDLREVSAFVGTDPSNLRTDDQDGLEQWGAFDAQ